MPLMILTHNDIRTSELESRFSDFAGDVFNLANVPKDQSVEQYLASLKIKLKDSKIAFKVNASLVVNNDNIRLFLQELNPQVIHVFRNNGLQAIYHALEGKPGVAGVQEFFAAFHECVGAVRLAKKLFPSEQFIAYEDLDPAVSAAEQYLQNKDEIKNWYKSLL